MGVAGEREPASGIVGFDVIDCASTAAVGQPRVDAEGPGSSLRTVVVCDGAHRQPCIVEFVTHADDDVERVSRDIGDSPCQGHARFGQGAQFPHVTVSESVNGRPAFMLVDRQLIGVTIEGIGAVFETIGEGYQYVSVAAGHHIICFEGHDDLLSSIIESTQCGTELGDDCLVATESYGILLTCSGCR
jgi:hypothetical protein